MTELTLPMPTAINATYKTGNGKFYKSEIAKIWEWDAKKAIREQFRGGLYDTVVYVGLEFFFKRDRDIDSGIKIVLDALQREGVIKNDNLVTHMNVKKYADKNNPRVEVTIEGYKAK